MTGSTSGSRTRAGSTPWPGRTPRSPARKRPRSAPSRRGMSPPSPSPHRVARLLLHRRRMPRRRCPGPPGRRSNARISSCATPSLRGAQMLPPEPPAVQHPVYAWKGPQGLPGTGNPRARERRSPRRRRRFTARSRAGQWLRREVAPPLRRGGRASARPPADPFALRPVPGSRSAARGYHRRARSPAPAHRTTVRPRRIVRSSRPCGTRVAPLRRAGMRTAASSPGAPPP